MTTTKQESSSEVVYFMKESDAELVKIGRTNDLNRRRCQIACGSARGVEVLACVPGGARTERAFHGRFAAHRIRGEWFHLTAEMRAWIDAFRFAAGVLMTGPSLARGGQLALAF